MNSVSFVDTGFHHMSGVMSITMDYKRHYVKTSLSLFCLRKIEANKRKEVDIALTKEMLINAFNGNYDVAILVAGDEDYVGLVNEVKRYGPIVKGAFFKHGLSDKLFLAVDDFQIIEKSFIADERLTSFIQRIT